MNILWNAAERRPRAGWRILAHGLLYLALVVASQLPVSLAAFALMAAGSAPADTLGGILSNPWLRLASVLMMLAAGLLALRIAARLLDKRPLVDYGFHFSRGWWLDFAFGLLLGALLMAAIFLVEQYAGWLSVRAVLYDPPPGSDMSLATVGGLGLAQYIMVGITEEILARGYQLRNLAEGLRLPRISPRTALLLAYLVSSTLFGLYHLANPNASLISSACLIGAGLFLGLGYVLTGELAIPIGLHITWNFFQGVVYGFPVSGTGGGGSLITIQQGGPTAWTGGAFGPEAGLIGLAALLVGCSLILAWVKLRRGKVVPQDRLAVYVGFPAMAASNPAEPVK